MEWVLSFCSSGAGTNPWHFEGPIPKTPITFHEIPRVLPLGVPKYAIECNPSAERHMDTWVKSQAGSKLIVLAVLASSYILVGGLDHFLCSISYMGCHPSH